MPAARCFIHIPGRGPTPALLTTEHPSSSYGLPVLVAEGAAYGPGDPTPFGARACFLFLTRDARAGEEGARLLGAWKGAQDRCRRDLREDAL